MNGAKEIRLNLSTVKNKVESFIGTLVYEEEEQKIEHVSLSKLEQILSQNSFSIEVTTQSDIIETETEVSTLIDIKGTDMIISDHGYNKFVIRNR